MECRGEISSQWPQPGWYTSGSWWIRYICLRVCFLPLFLLYLCIFFEWFVAKILNTFIAMSYVDLLFILFLFWAVRFQEIVPLNAGNVLVAEDNEPAAKWLALINQSLNRSYSVASRGSKSPLCSSLRFQKPSLKKVCKSFRTESGRRLKTCNCSPMSERKYSKDCYVCPPPANMTEDFCSSEEDEDVLSNYVSPEISPPASANQMKYSLITGKQMVGIFVTVWVRKELVQHVSHLRISNVGRGILGCLGNKVIWDISCSWLMFENQDRITGLPHLKSWLIT